MKEHFNYNPQVYELCKLFLADAPEKDTEFNRRSLAQHIQHEIEDHIAFMLLPNWEPEDAS